MSSIYWGGRNPTQLLGWTGAGAVGPGAQGGKGAGAREAGRGRRKSEDVGARGAGGHGGQV